MDSVNGWRIISSIDPIINRLKDNFQRCNRSLSKCMSTACFVPVVFQVNYLITVSKDRKEQKSSSTKISNNNATRSICRNFYHVQYFVRSRQYLFYRDNNKNRNNSSAALSHAATMNSNHREHLPRDTTHHSCYDHSLGLDYITVCFASKDPYASECNDIQIENKNSLPQFFKNT